MVNEVSRRSFLEAVLGGAIGMSLTYSGLGAYASPGKRTASNEGCRQVCEMKSETLPAQASVSAGEYPISQSTLHTARKTLTQMIADHEEVLRSKGMIAADERTSWSVYDIKAGKSLAQIGYDEPMQAASMMKPFVAMLFFDAVKEGKLQYTNGMRYLLTRMMQKSDNRATSRIMRMLGGPDEIDRALRGRYGHIFQDARIVEYVPKSGKTYRNMASAGDYTRFLSALWGNELPCSREILRLMSLPNGDRVKKKTRLVPRKTLLFHKTGSTNMLCGDAAILVPKESDGSDHPYIIVGIIQKDSHARPYRRWVKARGNVIREMSDITYSEIKRKYDIGEKVSYLR